MDPRRIMFAAVLCITMAVVGAAAQSIEPSLSSLPGSPGLRQNSFQNQTNGSVPTGTVSPQPIPLSLADAIERGLRQNLGLLISHDAQLSARGQLWQARSPLLPASSRRISENPLKINVPAEGFSKIASQFPDF